MPHFTLCPKKEPLLQRLRDTFKAVPLRVPSAAFQPLYVFSKTGQNLSRVGALKSLFVPEGRDFYIDIDAYKVANVQFQETSNIELGYGVEILSGFLEGICKGKISLKGAFEGASTMRFAFEEVEQRCIDMAALGSDLRFRRIDLENPVVKSVAKQKDGAFYIIQDTFCSPSIDVYFEHSSNTAFKLDLPAIKNLIKAINPNVQIQSKSETHIQFKGETSLTFAFNCMKLSFYPQDGSLAGLLGVTHDNLQIKNLNAQGKSSNLSEDLFLEGGGQFLLDL